ncbi:hypothetical protein FRC03_011832 [Tulasnella sp. 419]|nr:hypothetical protein FRC03_011832 [Tulasnella sp. 419]
MNPNRMGLGMRHPMGGGYQGQGPPISALASHPHSQTTAAPQQQQVGPKLACFVGNISPGITDNFISSLLSTCGSLRSFKRTPTATGKPGGFGFAEFDEPDAISRALKLLDGVVLPSLEESAGSSKPLRITADAKTKALLEAYEAQKMQTDADSLATMQAETLISSLLQSLKDGLPDEGKDANASEYVVPAHLKDLQEADLPESQRGIVLSEIAAFRDRAMKKDKDKPDRDRMYGGLHGHGPPTGPGRGGSSQNGAYGNTPRERTWGRPAPGTTPTGPAQQQQSQKEWGHGPQSYANKPVGFVKSTNDDSGNAKGSSSHPGDVEKSDEELERERKAARARKEESSFKDRERRYEPREYKRITAIERAMTREQVIKESEARDREAMKASLEAWDDDESDELFYTDRAKWRARRARILQAENNQDAASRNLELRQAEHLRQESEAFLARQMEDMRSLAEEQRKAGMLLVGEDAGPLRLNMSLGFGDASAGAGSGSGATSTTAGAAGTQPKPVVAPKVFGDQEDEEEEHGRKRRKGPMLTLDFGAGGPEAAKERLNKLKEGVSKDKDILFKHKVRWEALNDHLIDTKFEALTKRKMKDYLGEMEDDDLVMFVVEHLKDHKGPQKLVEGLEPVLVEEAEEFVVLLWRQVVFESAAYAEGLDTGDIMLA